MAGALDRDSLKVIVTPETKYNQKVSIEVKVSAAYDWIPKSLPALGTAYRDCKSVTKIRQEEFGDHVFTDVRGSGDYWYLTFAAPKTATDLVTPFYEGVMRVGNHSWPAILKQIRFERSTSFPNTVHDGARIIAAPRYYTRIIDIPAIQEGTVFYQRKYFGPAEFDIPQHEVPQPDSVRWDFLGTEGQYEECLHDDVEIEGQQDSLEYTTVAGGAIESQVGFVGGQSFKATNMKTRLPYILTDDQQDQGVGHLRMQLIVIPPSLRHRRKS